MERNVTAEHQIALHSLRQRAAEAAAERSVDADSVRGEVAGAAMPVVDVAVERADTGRGLLAVLRGLVDKVRN